MTEKLSTLNGETFRLIGFAWGEHPLDKYGQFESMILQRSNFSGEVRLVDSANGADLYRTHNDGDYGDNLLLIDYGAALPVRYVPFNHGVGRGAEGFYEVDLRY